MTNACAPGKSMNPMKKASKIGMAPKSSPSPAALAALGRPTVKRKLP